MKINIAPRTIYHRDNLDVLNGINDGCIDLVYLDPPFNKKKTFTAPIGSSAEGASFKDIFREEDVKDEWVDGIRFDNPELHEYLKGVKTFSNKSNYCYLVFMAVRLIEIHRILKDTGGVYLHCDPTMSHYLKIVLDCIFGEKNLAGNIIWKRHSSLQKGSQFGAKTWGVITDHIFHYNKGKKAAVFRNTIDMPPDEIARNFPLTDKNGDRYRLDNAHIFCTPGMGARPNLCYTWKGFKNPYPSGWRLSKKRLQEEYEKGNFAIKNGKLERRKYLKDYRGVPIGNLWDNILLTKRENINYPTQKPLALMERIIGASSKKGDVVLDPFCGCATTCVAAEKLGRKWIGVDVSHKAFELVKARLENEVPSRLLGKEPDYTTIPPKRAEKGGGVSGGGFVYVISNKAWTGMYKVGIAKDVKRRLNSYQTSDPKRRYKIEYQTQTPKYLEIEKYIHDKFDSDYEWVKAEKSDIIRAIKSAMRGKFA